MNQEIWKPIKGFENRYEISSKGRVKSLNWRNHGIERIITQKEHNRGYLQVELTDGIKSHMFLVHRLVASAFIANPDKLPLVNHKDENKKNNDVSNLEWCTQSDNMKWFAKSHVSVTDLKRPGRRVKLTTPIIQLTKDGEKVCVWESVNSIKRTTGYRDSHITD